MNGNSVQRMIEHRPIAATVAFALLLNETITLSLPAPGSVQTTGSTTADADASPAGGSQPPGVNAKRDR
jgi:hypothetical protein